MIIAKKIEATVMHYSPLFDAAWLETITNSNDTEVTIRRSTKTTARQDEDTGKSCNSDNGVQ